MFKPYYYKVFAIVILCCLGIIIYSNTFYNSFNFDDSECIIANSSIRDISNLKVIWNFWPTRFITFLSFAVNYHFNGLNVFGYHLANFIIHLGSSALVWWFILLILSSPQIKNLDISKHSFWIALFCAAIFLSNPLQTESVTYICQRTSCLSGFFYLFSLCLYVKSRLLRLNYIKTSKAGISYLFSLVFAAVSMFTKESTFTLPFMIILLECCFLSQEKRIEWKYLLPFLFLLLIIPILLYYGKPPTLMDMERFMAQPVNAKSYLMTQPKVIVTYIRLIFLPLSQNLDYDYPITKTLFELPTLSSLLFLVIILFAAVKLFSKYRLISFGIFSFFLMLLPESSIIPIEDVIFEHRLYLPMVSYSLVLVSMLYYIFGRKNFGVMALILSMVIFFYAASTYSRNFDWRDDFTLWSDTVNKSPRKARPYSNRGNAYLARGYFDKAIADYNKAIEINPDFIVAYNNRGIAYMQKGNFGQAIADYNKALEINPNYVFAYNYRGLTYIKKGNLDQAISDFSEAIRIKPDYAEAYYFRGLSWFYKNKIGEGLKDIDKAKNLGYEIDYGLLEKIKKVSVKDR